MTTTRFLPRRLARLSLAAVAAFGLNACSGETALLDVDAPQVLLPDDITGAAGASALRNGVRSRVFGISSGGENLWLLGGLLADEWRGGDTFVQRQTIDQRVTLEDNSFLFSPYRGSVRVREEAFDAIARIREVNAATASTVTSPIGELFTHSAYALVLLAEHFCSPMPISGYGPGGIEPAAPISRDSVLRLALAYTDSALANRVGPDSAAVRQYASVIRGRILVNLGQFAQAAAAVAGVPTTFTNRTAHSINVGDNQIWALGVSARRYVLGDGEGTNGINFVAANDPRVRFSAAGASFDGSITNGRYPTNYDRFSGVNVASGVEARLIEAEAALNAGDAPGMYTILNTLRATTALYACPSHITGCTVTALPALVDPGTAAGRQDDLMRERAFWMFGTGHRLGDLRRLVRQYGRTATSVYPTGAYVRQAGAQYGTAFVLPIPIEERNNPLYASAVCTNLNP
ncbi:MAG: hypothetical protein SFW08_12230 [Gemmatimonadaceae bacterium]|nr:hypothetical protein [Gemmatimonadaceae bacterium]